MPDEKEAPVIMLAKNKLEYSQLTLWGWVRGERMLAITPDDSSLTVNTLKRIPFLGAYIKNSIKTRYVIFDEYKKNLFYDINAETINIVLKFYNQEIRNKNKLLSYYNKIFNTDKFEAFIKKELSHDVLSLLAQLHFIRISGQFNKRITLIRDRLSSFVLNYVEEKYKLKYNLRQLRSIPRLFLLYVYYGWLLREFFRRGVVFNKPRRSYKLCKETAWGFGGLTLRDDLMLDGSKFKIGDILMLGRNAREYNRVSSFREAKMRGFDTAFVPKLKVNINKNIFGILNFYFWVPLKSYFRLFLEAQIYSFYYIFLFHIRCFPVEVLMNLYKIGACLAITDYGDIAVTIILNKYGTKDIIFHWSDQVTCPSCFYAFNAPNVYFTWGSMHYDYRSDHYFVDKHINIGCIFKRAYNQAVGNRQSIISRIARLRQGRPIVAFFDTCFENCGHVTDSLFLDYIQIIKEFCQVNRDANVLLKPKIKDYYEKDGFGSGYTLTTDFRDEARFSQFRETWSQLKSLDNFIYLDPEKWSIEEAIAVSDVCISMAKTSPSTIALVCGKNALYFDNTTNNYYPFAEEYKNKIVFEDKELLFEQIANILEGKFNCRDVFSEEQMRSYDAFSDDCALERLRDSLYRLVSSSEPEDNLSDQPRTKDFLFGKDLQLKSIVE